ncbi:hypothetical protein SAMN05192561_101306 [Halopenitus malekzadehii]|uniref:Uncharacterized protein n=1 Tax=Halopenitus malekzadehii TaxID=1267564 RepID=A0A1H6HSK5_9EURY|nr:hypothetical protein [Halopenitus malekzadehii]SEH38030.1 hypothetical protein SAMN05192561_101306 [Halopenitus malekzadehii]
MGLRCLLGHDFGEPELEREREEEGEQVVVTVREVKRCDRCGESQIVSENTEVTSLDRLAEEATRAEQTEATTAAGGVEPAETAETGEGDATAEAGETITAAETTEAPDGAESTSEPDQGSASDPGAGQAESDPGITVEGDVPADVDADPNADGSPPIQETTGTLSPDEKEDDAVPDDGAELIDEGGDETEDVTDGIDPEATDALDAEPGPSGGAGTTVVDVTTESEKGDHAGDDGIILDDGVDDTDESPTREHGEWPEEDSPRTAPEATESGDGSDTTAPTSEAGTDEADGVVAADTAETDTDLRSDRTPWPNQRGEDEGFSANADPDAGEDVDGAVSFGGGLTPEAEGPSDYDEATEVLERPAETDSTVSSGTADDRGRGSTVEDPGFTAARTVDDGAETEEDTTEYFCPECDLVESAGRSSMRAGDICPECKRGYIAERPIADSA